MPSSYTRALEERVAFLEIHLQRIQQQIPEGDTLPSATSASASPVNGSGNSSGNSNALGEVVEFLSVGNFEAPAYIGSASGLSLAVNLGEMVQATVWNKALPSLTEQRNGHRSSVAEQNLRGERRGKPITMDVLRTNSAEPPSDQLGSRILNAYLTQLHPRYPFLDPAELWSLHADRLKLAKTRPPDLSNSERFGLFKLYLVYAIGAMLLQLTEKFATTAPEVGHPRPMFIQASKTAIELLYDRLTTRVCSPRVKKYPEH
jgi:hypothetical protein